MIEPIKKVLNNKFLKGKRKKIIYDLYYYFFRNDELEKKKSFGDKNPDKIFYVIRPRKNSCEGLLSLVLYVCIKLEYAYEKGYIPVVDFKNYKTQYSKSNKENVWEYYFTQPSKFSLEEVYRSKNVILSGIIKFGEKTNIFTNDVEINDETIYKMNKFISKSFNINSNVENFIKKEEIDFENTIGVFSRGTDYVALKPTGEYIQPTVEELSEKVDILLERNKNLKIFLVTEDKNNYEYFKNRYGKKLIIASFDSFISDYNGKDYLSKSGVFNNLDGYLLGLHYISKILLLSKCKYFVGGITNGSKFALALNGNKYCEKYIFNLGIYE